MLRSCWKSKIWKFSLDLRKGVISLLFINSESHRFLSARYISIMWKLFGILFRMSFRVQILYPFHSVRQFMTEIKHCNKCQEDNFIAFLDHFQLCCRILHLSMSLYREIFTTLVSLFGSFILYFNISRS